MSDPIVSRAEIARQAAVAVQQASGGQPPVNPYPQGSESAEVWRITVERLTTADIGEGGA